MKVHWGYPTRDRTLTFDLPDGAFQMQLGASCPYCRNHHIVVLRETDRTFECVSPGRSSRTEHVCWPRLTYRIELIDVVDAVARVSEGNAPPFTVHALPSEERAIP